MTNDKLQMTKGVRVVCTKDFVSWFVIREPSFVISK